VLSSRVRVEIIRFGILVVLTLGLLSVAARAFDGEDGRRTAGGRPSATAPGETQSPDDDPTGSTDGGTSEPGSDAGGDGSDAGGDGSAVGTGGSGSGGSGGSGDGAIAAPELPRTGPDTALRLTGVALALIAGGALSLVGARRTA
jgi:hypothetical protein